MESNSIQPIVITNFSGQLTRVLNGDMNSGFAKYATTHGINTMRAPQNLSFMEAPRSIKGVVITDCIVAQKARVESGTISPPTFTGAGLNDMTAGGSFSGLGSATYVITIATTGTPDTFNWTDGTVTVTGVSMTGSSQSLNNGVTVDFSATTGHTAGNQWTFTASAFGFTAQFVYAVGHLGRVYKIQVNNPTGDNPDYDNPVLLTTITINSPTFTNGGSIEFYSGHIFIGSDQGVTQLNFDGSGESFVGSTGSWVQNVPRPSKLFVGNIYFGNGNNIAEVTSGLTVTTYTKLDPSFPTGYHVADLDVTYDGVYLVIPTVQNTQTNIFETNPDADQVGAVDSVMAYWNGSDVAATSFTSLPAFAITAYRTFGGVEFSFGYDTYGAAMNDPVQKILSLIQSQSPSFNATSSVGNSVVWMTPEYNGSNLVAGLNAYGTADSDSQSASHTRILRVASTLSNGDVLKVSSILTVSNLSYNGPSSPGYANNIFGTSKMYFSTFESNGTASGYNFYAVTLFPTGSGASIGGVYETQTQLFSQMVKVNQVRVYLEPIGAGVSFQVDLIGIDGSVIGSSGSITSASINQSAPTRYSFNLKMNGTPAIGVRITNLGTVNPYIHKVELDPVPFGI